MAIRAISNSLLIHAESPTDIEALGTNDGITADHIAWVEDMKSWATPLTISAATTVWNFIPLENPPTAGFYNSLQFYLDAANNLCNPNASAAFANDLRGNNTGFSITNVTADSSRYLFNGSTSFMSFNKTSVLDDLFSGASGGTVLMWVRTDNHTAFQKIVSTEGVSTNVGWSLAITSNSTLTFLSRRATDNGNWNAGPTSTQDLSYVGQWQMVALTYDAALVGNDPSFYVDGLLRNTTEVGAPPVGAISSDAGQSIFFGDDEASNNPFGGNIQTGLMWTRQLDADEIQAIYDATKGQFQPSNLSIPAGIPRDDLACFVDAGNQQSFPNTAASGIRDLLGNANAGLLDGVTITDSHMNFDGTNDNITFTKKSPLNNLMVDGVGGTVMVWCRTDVLGADQTLVSTRGAANNDGWELQIAASGLPTFLHDWSTANFTVGGTTEISAGGPWASITYAGDSNGGGLYFNGKTSTGTSFGGTGVAADDTGNDLYVGQSEDTEGAFDGDIDVVILWNRILSPAEIKQAHDVMRQRFITEGMTLIDTLTATSDVTTLTFEGLNGNADGTYYLTGRTSCPAGLYLEMRPNGLATNMFSIVHSATGATGNQNSTTGLLLAGFIIPDGSNIATVVVDAWLYPEENKGGSTSTRSGRRIYSGKATYARGAPVTTGTLDLVLSGGIWDEATINITSLELVATGGLMETGTSFSLYYIEDAD